MLPTGAPPPVVTDAEVYALARVDGGYAAEAPAALCVANVADSDDCEALPQAARESNAFEIRFAAP